jgi:hypothetical protein
MKHHYVFALALGAALMAAPAFAQEADKPADNPKPQAAEKDKAVKPANGSMKAQEANQEKVEKDKKADKNDKADRHDTSRMPQSDQEPAVQDRDKDKADHDKADRDKGDHDRADRNKAGDHDRDNKEISERDRNTHVTIRSDAKDKLREHYARNGGNRTHTVTVVREQVLPVEVRTRVEPVPTEYVSYLGPAPSGFMYGFVDGYVVLYDPNTFFVVDVLPLW